MQTTTVIRHCVVGPGRLGAALLRALSFQDQQVDAVGVRLPHASDAGAAPPRLSPAEAVRTALRAARGRPFVVWLCVPDDAIAAAAAETAAAAGYAAAVTAVHCSGLAGLDVLAPWRRAGAGTLSLHPLHSFVPPMAADRPEDVEPNPFVGVPMAVTAATSQDQALGFRLSELLGGAPFALADADKSLYHLAATAASNLLVALLSQAGELMRQATHGAGVEDGLQLLAGLTRTSLENVLRLGPERALTGPVARGDAGTVRAHLALLARQPARLGAGYCTLSLQALALAAPRLDDDTVQALHDLLGAYPDQESAYEREGEAQ